MLLTPIYMHAQTESTPTVIAVVKKAESLAAKGWKVPRTPDGYPDLQGYYTNVSLTPMTRPKALADREFLTPEEAANDDHTKVSQEDRDNRVKNPLTDVSLAYNNAFYDSGTKVLPTLQTSIVVDPPDGQIPPVKPVVAKEMAEHEAMVKKMFADPTRVCSPGYMGNTQELEDKASDFSLMARCIKWGAAGPPMLPSIYDSNYHIIQTPKYVMIQVEGGRSVRIIPTDGSPHVPSNIRLWLGDSRGHWEGNTLVVDTTNFKDAAGVRGEESGRNLHVIERFTKVAPNVLLYEFIVDDPTTFTRDWTGIIPMTAIKGPIFEYACNEGNYGLADSLRGARTEEKKRAD